MINKLYALIRALLFKIDAEKAHKLMLCLLPFIPSFMFAKYKGKSVDVMGMRLAHQVGLAAGLDKNGKYIKSLARLGFAFIEVGTVTPCPQAGNPKPRLFRIPKARAIINRMGFNNHGVDELVKNVACANYKGVLGINIGKNLETILESAVDDYLYCMRKVYKYADYLTVNLSSPNTPDLRKLQQQNYLGSLLEALKKEQATLAKVHARYVPVFVKISPDEKNKDIEVMVDSMIAHKIDGVIAVNTSLSRDGVENLENSHEKGGLSGAPIAKRALDVVRLIKEKSHDKLIIIGVGGIDSASDAEKMLAAGASLVQIYSGLIYKGPGLIQEIVKRCA